MVIYLAVLERQKSPATTATTGNQPFGCERDVNGDGSRGVVPVRL